MPASTDLKSQLLGRIRDSGAASVWTPADLLDLGGGDAVDKVLQRLVHAGELRRIHLGTMVITFRLTAASKLYWAGRPAMRIVQALHWLRDTLGGMDEPAIVRQRVFDLLHDGASADRLRDDLRDGLSNLPTWMHEFLRPLLKAEPRP